MITILLAFRIASGFSGIIWNQKSDFYSVGFDLVIESLSADAQTLGCLELIPTGVFEHLHNGVALDPFQ
jgi:hypothetical protein